MWVFYLLSLPMTIGMVVVTLKYFAGPRVPFYVFLTVGYAWFSSLSIIILVPADIWTTIGGHDNHVISVSWGLSYWSTFFLTWYVVMLVYVTSQCVTHYSRFSVMAGAETVAGYEDAGDFTWTERLKTSLHVNLVYYLALGLIGLFGLVLLITMRRDWNGGVLVFAMACSNTFGLVTGAFLLGFGLSEIPQSLWKNADWTFQQKVFSHKIAKMAAKLDEAHQNYSDAIVVAQATSNQMTKRDPLRPYMDIIDGMLAEMFKEDPSFKPQGGRLGENDMDYDEDDKSMATLRRQLRLAHEDYYRYKSEYMTHVLAALELEDTIKNYELRDVTGWKYVSSLRGSHSGSVGSILDTIELLWRCFMRNQLQRVLAVVLGCMSVAVLLAEATLLPSGVDLSLFSILIKSVRRQEFYVQVLAFIPLMYMCICTYYSLFKIGMLMFYSLTPRQTSSVSLLMICSMVARYAPPISYNFLNLICLDQNAKTVFEERMGNIDDVVPFFGKKFNRIYPLIMVIYTLLVASNFFDRVISYFGSWMRFRFGREQNDMDGFDASGVIILQKERSWLEQGKRAPLAINVNNISLDVESGSNEKDQTIADGVDTTLLKNSNSEAHQNRGSGEVIRNKYTAMREESRLPLRSKLADNSPATPSGLSTPWQTMKSGIQNIKTNFGSNKFLPLQQSQENERLSQASSSNSLDEIFQRLKRTTVDTDGYSDDRHQEQ